MASSFLLFSVFCTLFSLHFAFANSDGNRNSAAMATAIQMRSIMDIPTKPIPEGTKFNKDVIEKLMNKLVSLAYALKSTYVPNNDTMTKFGFAGSLPQMLSEDSVPEKIKQFFSCSEDQALEGSEKTGYDCVDRCSTKAPEAKNNTTVDGETTAKGNKTIDKTDDEQPEIVIITLDDKDEHETYEKQLPINVNCSKMIKDMECLKSCEKDENGTSSSFAQFVVEKTSKLTEEWCGNDSNKQVEIGNMLDQCEFKFAPLIMSEFLWQKGLPFIDDFLAAKSVKEQCSLIKKILIDEFSSSLQTLCQSTGQVKEMVQLAAGYVLAVNSNGTMIQKCPEIYQSANLEISN